MVAQILACDGIWDVMNNYECCDAVRTLLMEGERDMGNCCEELLMMCLDKGSKDNMSATIVSFPAARYVATTVVKTTRTYCYL